MDYESLITMAVRAGELMLVSGAEVYRVEDTVSRILRQSGLEHIEVFVLATGVFASISDPSIPAITIVKRVSTHSTNLNRIYRVNDISRRFCGGGLTVTEASAALEEIASAVEYDFRRKCIGYAMVTGFFAVLFGGGLIEVLASGAVGLVLAFVLAGAARLKLNEFCQNAAGALILALMSLFIKELLLPRMNLDAVIISSIMPLVPGVTFTSAIRDTLNGDYGSGVARIAEAVVVALAVASGVGAAMVVFRLTGGAV